MIRRACTSLNSRSSGAWAAAIAADRADEAREPGLAMAGWSRSNTITRSCTFVERTASCRALMSPAGVTAVIRAPRVAEAARVAGALRVAGAARVTDVTGCDEVAGAALAGSCCPIAKLSTTPAARPARPFRLVRPSSGLLPATLLIQSRPSERAEIARHFETYTEELDMEHT